MNGSPSDTHSIATGVLLRQWGGLLVPPLAWGAHLTALYLLATVGCERWLTVGLYGATAIGLALASWGGWMAWRSYRDSGAAPVDAGTAAARRRFFGLTGLFGAALFFVAIVAQLIPVVIRPPC